MSLHRKHFFLSKEAKTAQNRKYLEGRKRTTNNLLRLRKQNYGNATQNNNLTWRTIGSLSVKGCIPSSILNTCCSQAPSSSIENEIVPGYTRGTTPSTTPREQTTLAISPHRVGNDCHLQFLLLLGQNDPIRTLTNRKAVSQVIFPCERREKLPN